MGSVNKERITDLIAEILNAKEQLVQYAAHPMEENLASAERMNSMKYLFIVAIEACIDICQHISAKLFQMTPDSYSGCFEVLVSKQILSRDLGERIAELARFRNVLVHLYWKVDDRRVVGNLTCIGTLEEYAKAIASYLKMT
jgi:uncharacterized protein YutE (UPF0331/DUF86 family)